MSTRANVIIANKKYDKKLYFYRHSDGYPEGTLPTLEMFVDWMKKGKIRNDVQQSAGWLVVLGALEYTTMPDYKTQLGHFGMEVDIDTICPPKDWKVGAYEPTTGIHEDIEHLYIIDVDEMKVYEEDDWNKWE